MVFSAIISLQHNGCGVRTKTIATLGAIVTVCDLERGEGAVRKGGRVIWSKLRKGPKNWMSSCFL